jgi:lipoprotein-releasing system permease protein
MTPADASRGSAFEWFVAWRHLRDPERRSHRMLIVGGVIMALAFAVTVATYVVAGMGPDEMIRMRTTLVGENVRLGAKVVFALGALIGYFGLLRALSFSVFTALSIVGITLGTTIPIVALSVMSGFENDLKAKIRGTKADVVITMPDGVFTGWDEVRKKIARVPNLVASTPYLEGEVMIRTGPAAAGIIVRGIDPETAPAVLDLSRALRDGKLDHLVHPERIGELPAGRVSNPFEDLDRFPPPPPRPKKGEKAGEGGAGVPEEKVLPGIILGEELYAHTLRVFIGSEVEVACPMCRMGPTGFRPGVDRFRVAGHFYSGMYEFDSKLAYISLAQAQQFLRMPGEVTGIDVRTRTPEDARQVAAAVQGLLGKRYEVRSWEEMNRALFMALRIEKILMFTVLTFIALVASFSIVSTLIMSATQKAREVAILKSMGATSGAIARVFFAEGLYIGVIGLTVGSALGIGICLAIKKYGLQLPADVYYISQLPVVMRASEIVSIALVALLLSCLATVYPAVVASRMRPVEGLKYE